MIFNEHSEISGKHAFIGASSYYRWLGRSEEEMLRALCSSKTAEIGTILHSYAADRIKYKFALSKYDRKNVMLELLKNNIPASVINYINFPMIYDNLRNYVNDCISDFMQAEVGLKYSDKCFGTADAIQYDEKDNILRIYDLKTGTTPAHMEQLLVYSALFYLENRDKKLSKSDTILRIYQCGEVIEYLPQRDEILPVMDEIKAKEAILIKMLE